MEMLCVRLGGGVLSPVFVVWLAGRGHTQSIREAENNLSIYSSVSGMPRPVSPDASARNLQRFVATKLEEPLRAPGTGAGADAGTRGVCVCTRSTCVCV